MAVTPVPSLPSASLDSGSFLGQASNFSFESQNSQYLLNKIIFFLSLPKLCSVACNQERWLIVRKLWLTIFSKNGSTSIYPILHLSYSVVSQSSTGRWPFVFPLLKTRLINRMQWNWWRVTPKWGHKRQYSVLLVLFLSCDLCHVSPESRYRIRESSWKDYIKLEEMPEEPQLFQFPDDWVFPNLDNTQTYERVSFSAPSLRAGPADAKWSRNKLSLLSPIQFADSWQNKHCYCLKPGWFYHTALYIWNYAY